MNSLAGKGVLITRPAARAVRLAALVRAAGGEPVLFPTLEILSISDNSESSKRFSIENMISTDMLIFVSPTAVEHGLGRMGAAARASWPAHIRVAAVGRATARALLEQGIEGVLAPFEGSDSEALAALPELQAVNGKRILIVRGEGGRAWLGDTLRKRGAAVEYAECYRRIRPDADAAPLAVRWRAGAVAAVTLTSRQALDNLLAMLPAACREVALATPMFAVHERLAAHARALGAKQTVVTGAGDEAMIEGMKVFFAKVA